MIRLRALEPSDLDTVYRWENDPANWPAGNTSAPLSRFQLEEYIKNYSSDIFNDRQLRLIIEEDGQAVGTLDLFDFDARNSRTSLGILVAAPFRRRGIASVALRQAEDYCRRTLNLHQIWVTVSQENTASLALFKLLGYTTSGRFRSWLRVGRRYLDAILLQRFL